MVTKASGRKSRLSFVRTLSLIASVWITMLVTVLVGNQLLLILTLVYASVVTAATTFLLVKPRKISVPVTQEEKVPEKPLEQLA